MQISETTIEEIQSFEENVWKPLDVTRFGRETLPDDWERKWFVLKAEIEDKVAGTLRGYHMAGVFFIIKFSIAEGYRGQGIGSSLLEALENKLRSLKAHKIMVETGKEWDSNKFYLAKGFTKISDLDNHYFNKDFVQYSKVLYFGN